MGSDTSDIPDRSDDNINEDIRALFEECLQKVRRQDTPESWKDIQKRIGTLRERLDHADGKTQRPHFKRAWS